MPSIGDTAGGRNTRTLAALGLLGAFLVLGLVVLMLLGSGGAGTGASPALPGGSGGSTASTAGSPSMSASAAATASATPTATATATVDPYAGARAASDEMRAAIEAARGSGGLNGHEAKDLESTLTRFNRALDQQDPTAARDEANKLAGQVSELVNRRAVDAQAAARLRTAVDQLVAAANALPG
jgi:hypothetical protein